MCKWIPKGHGGGLVEAVELALLHLQPSNFSVEVCAVIVCSVHRPRAAMIAFALSEC